MFAHSIKIQIDYFSAHRFAMRRAASNLSAFGLVKEIWSGLEQAKLMKQIGVSLCSTDSKEIDQFVSKLIERMESIWKFISYSKRSRLVWFFFFFFFSFSLKQTNSIWFGREWSNLYLFSKCLILV